jgi:hypothetical protein
VHLIYYAILHYDSQALKCNFALHFWGSLASMALWRFLDYHSAAGNNLIEEWYLDLPVVAQAEFDVILKTLSITADWRGLSEFDCLGRYGLCEIRFKAGKIQYRPAGFFGPGEKCFSIYVGCSKKGRIYTPPDAFDLAIKRKGKVARKEASLHERFV